MHPLSHHQFSVIYSYIESKEEGGMEIFDCFGKKSKNGRNCEVKWGMF